MSHIRLNLYFVVAIVVVVVVVVVVVAVVVATVVVVGTLTLFVFLFVAKAAVRARHPFFYLPFFLSEKKQKLRIILYLSMMSTNERSKMTSFKVLNNL